MFTNAKTLERKGRTPGARPQKRFPVLMKACLADEAAAGLLQVQGRQLQIHDKHLFASTLLPKYWGHGNIESFKRGANDWGIKSSTPRRGGCRMLLTHESTPLTPDGLAELKCRPPKSKTKGAGRASTSSASSITSSSTAPDSPVPDTARLSPAAGLSPASPGESDGEPRASGPRPVAPTPRDAMPAGIGASVLSAYPGVPFGADSVPVPAAGAGMGAVPQSAACVPHFQLAPAPARPRAGSVEEEEEEEEFFSDVASLLGSVDDTADSVSRVPDAVSDDACSSSGDEAEAEAEARVAELFKPTTDVLMPTEPATAGTLPVSISMALSQSPGLW